MSKPSQDRSAELGNRVEISCTDGLKLVGNLWRASEAPIVGNVIINPATGVLARYYHRYARFLAAHGFNVLTYDYRGIGQSRPIDLKQCCYRWRDWGGLNFDGALQFMQQHGFDRKLSVVGHSIGGFLIGLADTERGKLIDRILTVGAQYGWWGDYAAHRRADLFLKWHVAMPLLTMICGYFPGCRLGWLEDLPAGIAYEWSFRRSRFEQSYPKAERTAVLDRMAAIKVPILAVVVSDDELGTVRAIRRTLSYYSGAHSNAVLIEPRLYQRKRLGHFDLFHDRHSGDFWMDTVRWLREGRNPWDEQVIDPLASATRRRRGNKAPNHNL